MNVFKSIVAAAALTVAMSSTAFAGANTGFASIDAAVTQDKKVSRVERSLARDKFELVSMTSNTIYYIVAPTEGTYKTSEVVYTYVGAIDGNSLETDYATVTIDVMYSNDNGNYSVGDVAVSYKTVF